MRHHWRNYEVFDEDPREKFEVSHDVGLCPIWDKNCASRTTNVWKASHKELAPSFIDEALNSNLDGVDQMDSTTTDYARCRFIGRVTERTRSS